MSDIALAFNQEAIIAQCTPQGVGALALLRISGINAVSVVSRIAVLASGASLCDLPTHTIHYGWVVDVTGERIDNVLFLLMRGPKTFTGQDTVEITCHNNSFIIEHIIEQAIAHGARLAQNGEFSCRAVLNNKIDIVQAEAINELIGAQTQMGLKQALAQVNGSFSRWIQDIEKKLVKAIAFCEASFEFIDEEMAFDAQIRELVSDILHGIATAKVVFDKQVQIRQGIRVAIVGSVNVGKSSLFNLFLHQKRAIVTNIPGTTRDVIEAGLSRGGYNITLVDTAGLRETDDIIEQEGIVKSFEQADMADIILLVFDASRLLTAGEESIYKELYAKYPHKIIEVRNKIDKMVKQSSLFDRTVDISTLSGIGLSALYEIIETCVGDLFSQVEAPFLLNKRQSNILLLLEREMRFIETMMISPISYELVSYHFNDALAHCSQLTGKTISEQGMDAVFREFCVGK